MKKLLTTKTKKPKTTRREGQKIVNTKKVINETPEKPIKRKDIEYYNFEGKDYVVGSIIPIFYYPKTKIKSQKKEKKKRGIESKALQEEIPEYDDVREVDDDEEHGSIKRIDASDVTDNEAFPYHEENKGITEYDSYIPYGRPNYPRLKQFEYTDYIEKLKPVMKGKTATIAKNMGLVIPEKHYLKPKRFKGKTDESIRLVYGNYDYYVVTKGPKGLYLKPYIPSDLSTKILRPESYLQRIPIHKKSKKTSHQSIKIDDCVKFVKNEKIALSGIAIKINSENFDLVTDDGHLYKNISFENVVDGKIRSKNIPDDYRGQNGSIQIVTNGAKLVFKIETKGNLTKTAKAIVDKWIRFDWERTYTVDGKVIDFDKDNLIVSNKSSETETIGIDDVTLLKVKCNKTNYVDVLKGSVKPETYFESKLDNQMRDITVTQLFKILSEVIPNVFEYQKGINVEDDAIKKLRESVNWSLINLPKIDFDHYYDNEFKKWLNFDLQSRATNGQGPLADIPNFEKYADDFSKKFNSGSYIIEYFKKNFGKEIFDNNVEYVVNSIETKLQEGLKPEPFVVGIRNNLIRLGVVEQEKIKGTELAIVLSNVISNTISKYPINSGDVYKEIISEWTKKEIDEYIPTKKDKAIFKKTHQKEIKILYKKYSKEYDEQIALREKYYENVREKKIENQKKENEPHSFFEGKKLSYIGQNTQKDVKLLEKSIYTSTKGDGLKYIRKIVELMMFLDKYDEIGKHCDYFRTKVASGMFKVKNLDSCTFLHMFPEFFFNSKNLKKSVYKRCLDQLSVEIYDRMIDFVNMNFIKTISRRQISKFGWDRYAKPLNKTCETKRISDDVKYDTLHIDNYQCDTSKGIFSCKANLKPESIPYDDLILCYDTKTESFTCSSLNDILHAIRIYKMKKDPINPFTGDVYPKDFLRRMEKRYGDLLTKNIQPRVYKFEVDYFGDDEKITSYF